MTIVLTVKLQQSVLSAPVVQDHQLPRGVEASLFEVPDRTEDVVRLHVPLRVIVVAHQKDSRVAASAAKDQVVKIVEVLIIRSKEDQTAPNGMVQVLHVLR